MNNAYRLMEHVTTGKCLLAHGKHPEDKWVLASHQARSRTVAADFNSSVGIVETKNMHNAASNEYLNGCLKG